jgi:hypothetical protein
LEPTSSSFLARPSPTFKNAKSFELQEDTSL